MKVLIVSTFQNKGGAAVAASRLAKALRRNGVDVHLLVRDREVDSPYVSALPGKWLKKWRFLWERLCIWVADGLRRDNLFQVSLANTGADITKLSCFRQADIVHLHWINQGMLSLSDVGKIASTAKPLVWTMHDMWNITPICHCDDTFPQHHRWGLKQLARLINRRKHQLYERADISFVACSHWLEEMSRKSELLEGRHIVTIPNPIDTEIFKPQKEKTPSLRKKYALPTNKKLLLFASMNVSDPRKGFEYLLKACRMFQERYPHEASEVEIVVLGRGAEHVCGCLSLPAHPLGFVDNEVSLAEIYNMVDAYLTPSLVDNLPNTVMEPLACGVPCIGFDTGGIPEMIIHRHTGYLVPARSVSGLVDAMKETLFGSNTRQWGESARKKVEECYSESVVARQYLELYKSKIY